MNFRSNQTKQLCYSQKQRISGESTSLLETLFISSPALTFNGIDKVYTLLGLSYDYGNYIPEPKYGWSPKELCFEMTRSVVVSRRSLDIIFAGPYRDRKAAYELPSWCPDYLHYLATIKSLVRILGEPPLQQAQHTAAGEPERSGFRRRTMENDRIERETKISSRL
jgi:hypothetical protein